MAEPTAEHFEEARAWLLRHVDRDLFPEAYVIDLAEALAAREARGFERGQKTNPAAVWGWAAAVGGDGWLLCPMVLRGDRLVVDANDVADAYDEAAAEKHWDAMRDFFGAHLAG